MALIYGNVNMDGTVRSGTGFTAQRTATGTYRLVFDAPFDHPPALVLTSHANLWQDFGGGGREIRTFCQVVASDESQCKVVIGGVGGVPANRNFSFIAAGDRGP